MIRQARAMLATLLAFAAGATALAQERPSFDCAKADNPIDRGIRKNGELAKADREMAAAYTALLAKVSGAAKDELVKDQVGWTANPNGACRADPDNIEACLKTRYAARIKNLRAHAQGTYPAISEQSLAKRAARQDHLVLRLHLSVFRRRERRLRCCQRPSADAAKKTADEFDPKAADGPEREQQWYYQQGFTVERPPGGQAATIVVQFDSYRGGAHGYGATRCTLVDLRTGKVVAPQGVFTAGEQWLRVMSQLVGADLKKQFVDKPGFDYALEPANLAKLLSEANRYCWTGKQLEVIFTAYYVGPDAAGPYEVNICYDRPNRSAPPWTDRALAVAPLPAPFLSRWPARRRHRARRAWIAPRRRRRSSARSAPSPSLPPPTARWRRPMPRSRASSPARRRIICWPIRSAGSPTGPRPASSTRRRWRNAWSSRDRDRTAQLEWLGEGAYPFISEQALVKSGKVRGIPYIIDASYPQFDAGAVDFSGVNRQLRRSRARQPIAWFPARTPTMTAATTAAWPGPTSRPTLSQAGPKRRSVKIARAPTKAVRTASSA